MINVLDFTRLTEVKSFCHLHETFVVSGIVSGQNCSHGHIWVFVTKILKYLSLLFVSILLHEFDVCL